MYWVGLVDPIHLLVAVSGVIVPVDVDVVVDNPVVPVAKIINKIPTAQCTRRLLPYSPFHIDSHSSPFHFKANSRHTFLPHRIHDETYPPQRLCILSIGGLYGALQIWFYVMLCYVIPCFFFYLAHPPIPYSSTVSRLPVPKIIKKKSHSTPARIPTL